MRARDIVTGRLFRRLPYVRNHASYLLKRSIGGADISIPIINGQGFRHYWRFEIETFAILKSLVKLSPGVFVDIGANIGQTLVKAKAIDRQLPYIGFEPSPICCMYTDALITANNFEHCTLLPVGASDGLAVRQLYYSHSTDAAATTISGFWTGLNRKGFCRSIVVARADLMIRQIFKSKVGVVKIDVEGGELEALQGLESIITEDCPPIVVEILPASCDFDPAQADTKAGVALRLRRMRELVELIAIRQLRSYRLMPDGTLLGTSEFDSETFDPALTNYLLLPTSSPLDIGLISTEYGKAMSELSKVSGLK